MDRNKVLVQWPVFTLKIANPPLKILRSIVQMKDIMK